MADEKPIGAHGGGIPPGWDFPEAREAASRGVDLWLLDANLKLSVWERIEQSFGAAAMTELLSAGLQKH